MSIKIKLPLLVLVTFLFNILLLGGYYRFFLSTEISQDFSHSQEQLQKEAELISSDLKNRQNFQQSLNDISKSKNLVIRVEDESGNVVFHAGNEKDVDLGRSASSLFRFDNHVYLLTIIQSISLSRLSSFQVARNLFKAEILIICIILLFIAGVTYVCYVKPIVVLQENMERYQSGIRPVKITRKNEIGLLQNRFVELTNTIEEEQQKQNRMIASISHDIKTPLTSVMGYAERLKKNTLSPEKHEAYVDTIYSKSIVIKNLIEEFDEYLGYHMKSGLKQQKVTVEQLCGIIKLDYQEELEERGIAFSVASDCENEVISIDISKLRRVFGNIIGNSLKHFNTDDPFIAVACSKRGNAVVWSVQDNGAGVENEELKKIFDPFYTSDKGRSVAGLGLSISKEIVEAHDGKIWAENREESGLNVQIRLPLVKSRSGVIEK